MARMLRPTQVAFFVDGKRINGDEYLRSRQFDPETCVIIENEDRVLIIQQGGHGECVGLEDWIFLG